MKDARERKSIKRLASLLIFAAGLFLFTACGGPETAPPYLGTYMDADGGRIVVDETGVTVNGATHAYTATESGGVWTLAAGTETLYVFDGGAVLCADAAPIDTGGLDVRSGYFAAVFTMGSQTITFTADGRFRADGAAGAYVLRDGVLVMTDGAEQSVWYIDAAFAVYTRVAVSVDTLIAGMKSLENK